MTETLSVQKTQPFRDWFCFDRELCQGFQLEEEWGSSFQLQQNNTNSIKNAHLGHLQAQKTDFFSTSSEYSKTLGFSLSACLSCIKFWQLIVSKAASKKLPPFWTCEPELKAYVNLLPNWKEKRQEEKTGTSQEDLHPASCRERHRGSYSSNITVWAACACDLALLKLDMDFQNVYYVEKGWGEKIEDPGQHIWQAHCRNC